MSTNHVVEALDDFVHGLLGPEESAHIEHHCAQCPPCAAALEQARRRLALMQSLPPTEPPGDLVTRTTARVETQRQRSKQHRRRFTFVAGGVLTAALLLLGVAHGYYASLAPTNYDVVVMGQKELLAGSRASMRVRLVDRSGKAKTTNVPVNFTLVSSDGKRKTLAEVATDADGSVAPRFDVPDWAVGQYQLEVVARPGRARESVTRPVTISRSWKLMLSSDKPVYKPGQTIQLRAMALRRPDLLPVSAQSATFTLADPRGNILFKEVKPTSQYGITSAACELASEIEEGTYIVTCILGEGSDKTETKIPVEVRRYVLPKFTVEVAPNRPYYAPGDVAKVEVKAEYIFGKPVVKSGVEVQVRKGDSVIETLKGETDEKGKLEVKYPLPKPAGTEEPKDESYNFVATVTDTGGQKQSRGVGRLVTVNPVRVVAIPESGALVQGVPNIVYILVTEVDGSPVTNATVEVTGDVEAKTRTDDRGTTSFSVTADKPAMNWTLRVTRKNEVVVRRPMRLVCGKADGDFLLRTDRATYQGGQSMALSAFGAGREPVFVDLIKDGQTLASLKVAMSGGKGEDTFDLPPDVFGTVELVAYRFAGEKLTTRKRRVMYINPADALKITATLDREEYRPGRTAKLRMTLTDKAGKPTPGAISLAAVDEAVFGLMAQRPGVEQVFYTIDEELLKPVQAAGSWSPGDERAAQREQALFASTAQANEKAHTLAVRSFPEQAKQVTEVRNTRLGLVRWGWLTLLTFGLAFGYAALWMYLPARIVWRIHAYGLLIGPNLIILLVCVAGFLDYGAASPKSKSEQSGSEADTRWSERGRTRRFAMTVDDGESMPRGSDLQDVPLLTGRSSTDLDREESLSLNYNVDSIESFALSSRDLYTEASPVSLLSKARSSVAPRVRRHFPETLLWKPHLITDDNGTVMLPIALADSITKWRVAASAVSADGRLGAVTLPMKVFQPFFVEFNLPVSLTRGDEVSLPVVVYNYLDKPQSVKLTLGQGEWFVLAGSTEQTLDLGPGEVRSIRYTVRVKKVGMHKLRVMALAGDVGDAIEREIEIIPDGKKYEFAHSGALDRSARHTLTVPADAIEGSVKALVKLYPSGFSQLLEGADGIFRLPSGCFEQTSSTTYPNVLALQYLKRTQQKSPEAEAKARKFIHLGYQRLVGFEVKGGGFSWYGQPPTNRILTAYGLREFEAMAEVHPIDPNLITRTRTWLMSQRKADGSWDADMGELSDAKQTRLAASAYIAWAVFADKETRTKATETRDFILAHDPRQITNSYVLALVCNALLTIDPDGKDATEYLAALAERASLPKSQPEAQARGFLSWPTTETDRTLFHGSGEPASIETTALAVQALLRAKRDPALTKSALSWLVSKKDPNGIWQSTQATVLSLEALIAGTSAPGAEAGERRIEVVVNGKPQQLTIPADQAEVVKLLDVSHLLKPGDNVVTLTESTKTAANYQVVFRYHTPDRFEDRNTPLSITVTYDRDNVVLGESIRVKARATNNTDRYSPMVMLELPIPPGFEVVGDTAKWADGKTIAKVEMQPRHVVLYLHGLNADNAGFTFDYTLRATMPVKAMGPVARVYEYYDPTKQGTARPRLFTVREK